MVSRRNFVRTLGIAAGSAAVGSIGIGAFGDNAAAADAELNSVKPTLEATTDDGEIQYVSYGGRLRFEWDGLDQEATHGGYNVKVRVHTERTNNWSSWRDFGTGIGKLGDEAGAKNHDGDGKFEDGEKNSPNSWGGPNDTNSGPGTDGFFEFRFGDMFGNEDYAIATDGGDYGLRDAANTFPISTFESHDDGKDHRSVVEIKKTCFVMPSADGPRLVEDEAKGRFEVIVGNRARTGTTGGGIKGDVGADES